MSTLQALAAGVAEWFPELDGRAIAVSEVDPFNDKTNVPTLPIAIVGLIDEDATQATSGSGNITLSDNIVIQFLFEPSKYKRHDGADTPFYAYYDYEAVRDTLLTNTKPWRSPRNGSISYLGMNVESSEWAVRLTFTFLVTERWCPKVVETPCTALEPAPTVAIAFGLKPPPAPCCPPRDCEEEEDDDKTCLEKQNT